MITALLSRLVRRAPQLPPRPVDPPVLALDPVSRQLLDAHNRERALVGVPPLHGIRRWRWRRCPTGRRSPRAGAFSIRRGQAGPGQRENLWRGTAYAFLPAQMVGSWAAEKRYFRPGIFPAVSTTGNWIDVSHYTQMIWPTTTRVGCAIYRAPQWDYLICRYSPPGNVDGKPVP